MPTTRSRLAALTLSAALGTAVLSAGPALARGTDDATTPVPTPACTLSTEQIKALQDELALLKEQLKADKPTAAERAAFTAALSELQQAAREAKQSQAVREQKRAERAALAKKLSAATSPEQRAAIRAEMRAITLQLTAGKLTKAEKAEIRTKHEQLKRSLKNHLSKADRQAVQALKQAVQRLLEPCTDDAA